MIAVFLGSINVGGNRLAMADLCAVLAADGLGQVSSVVASGNLLLHDHPCAEPGLGARIGRLVGDRFGFATLAVARDLSEVEAALANPFAADGDPARVHVHWLESAPRVDGFAQLVEDHAGRGRERLAIGAAALYIDFIDGVAGSRLTSQFIERRLGCRGTARNLRSLARIRDRMQAAG